MFFLFKFLLGFPVMYLHWLGMPHVVVDGYYGSNRKWDKYNNSRYEHYIYRWMSIVPALIFLALALILIWLKPVAFVLVVFFIFFIDAILIGARAFWAREEIKKSGGTAVVASDFWKDK